MATVSSILINPVAEEPGQSLDSVAVGVEGLDGDRRKGSPVHLVTASDYVLSHPRANLVIDIDTVGLEALVGCRLRIGEVELEVTGPARGCPGVYADVPVPGTLSVGDEVTVGSPAS
ncbi:hypothetical protein V3N99_00065 [Dermatophilaceae bacterium Soc4.6]